MKLGDIMGMFRLQSSDSQQVSRKVMRRPQQMVYRSGRKMQRSITRTLVGATTGGGTGAVISRLIGNHKQKKRAPNVTNKIRQSTSKQHAPNVKTNQNQVSPSQTVDQMTGKGLDTKQRRRSNGPHRKPQVKHLPTSKKLVFAQGPSQLKQPGKHLKQHINQTKKDRSSHQPNRKPSERQNVTQKKHTHRQKTFEKQHMKTNQKSKISQHNQQRPQTQSPFKQQPTLNANTHHNKQKQPVIQQHQPLPKQRTLRAQPRILYLEPRRGGQQKQTRASSDRREMPSTQTRQQRKKPHPIFDKEIPKHRQKRPLQPKRRERR